MATKPSTLPEWATGGSAQIVEPTSGKKTVGHAPGERPPAQYLNWFKNLTWQWLAYLSDGALEGDHSIDGSLTVEGVTTLNGSLNATGGVTAGENTDVQVSGTGKFKHGARTMVIPAIAGTPESGASDWSATGGDHVSGTPLPHWYVPITLPDGARILEVRARVQDAANTRIRLIVYRATDNTPTLLGSDDSDQSGTVQTLAVTGLTEVVSHNTYSNSYFAQVSTQTGTGLGRLLGLYVTYDEP